MRTPARLLGAAVTAAIALGLPALVLAGGGTRARGPQQAGNLLVNPGAEDGEGAPDASAQPAVPGWQTTSTFTAVNYGAPDF